MATKKKTTKKVSKKKQDVKEYKINDLGFPVGVPRDYKHTLERVRILEENLLNNVYGRTGSKKFIKAYRHYIRYCTDLNAYLYDMGRDPRKKKFHCESFGAMYEKARAS